MKFISSISTKLSKETLMHIEYGLLVTIYGSRDEESGGPEELLSFFVDIPGEEASIVTAVPNENVKKEIGRWEKLLHKAGALTMKIERVQRSKKDRELLLKEAKEGIDIR